MKKICFLLMASILLIFMLSVTVVAANVVRPYVGFDDVKEQDWYYDYVKLCYQAGIMSGVSKRNFNPSDNLTAKDAVVLTSHLYQFYNQNAKIQPTDGDWFGAYHQYALQHNLILKDEHIDSSVINKEQFVVFISRVLPSSNLKKINEIKSVPSYLSKDAYEQVLLLYRAGVLSGNDSKGAFTAHAPITRAEVAVILSRIIYPNTRSLVNFDLQNQPKQKINISLQDLTITDFDDTYIYAKKKSSDECSVFDLSGRQVIPWQKNVINKISDGIFRLHGVDGVTNFYLNQQDVKINNSTYEFATDFDGGFAVVMDKDGVVSVINKQGETVRIVSEECFGLKLSGGYVYLADQVAVRLMKIQTGEVFDLPYNEMTPFINGVARVRYFEGQQPVSNLIDKSLTSLWTTKYAYLRWGENYFPVTQSLNNPLYGVADKTGKLIISPEYNEILANQNDVGLFYKDKGVSLRQMSNGKVLLALPNRENIGYTLNDTYLVKTTNDGVQNTVIDLSGREILKIETKEDKGMWLGRKSLVYIDEASLFYMGLE